MVLWDKGVNQGKLTPNEFVAVTSTNTAKIFNLYPRKGAIAVGSDADIVIWDIKQDKTFTVNDQMSKIDFNIFEGMRVQGKPITTICNGKIAWDKGELKSAPGDGQYVSRPPYANFYQSQLKRNERNRPEAVSRKVDS